MTMIKMYNTKKDTDLWEYTYQWINKYTDTQKKCLNHNMPIKNDVKWEFTQVGYCTKK